MVLCLYHGSAILFRKKYVKNTFYKKVCQKGVLPCFYKSTVLPCFYKSTLTFLKNKY